MPRETAQAQQAQQARREVSPLDLPRPGYEPHVTRLGSTVARLEADVSTLYDSNVYATRDNRIDDIVIHARPRLEIDTAPGAHRLHGEGYADIREHVDVSRESAANFGGALAGTFSIGSRHTLTGETRFDRAIESRADPEARADIFARPRKINIVSADLGYGFQGTRLGFDLAGTIQRSNFLDPTEHDRDMQIYRGSARLSWLVASSLSVFVQGYVNRRDFDTAVDLTGVDRDATTFGLLLGITPELPGRLRGRMGAGIFRSDPDAPMLRAFSGFAASGELTWSPRMRTAVTARLSGGDVATVRAGATGRSDTQIALQIDQEARHNLLLHATASYKHSKYRGISASQTLYGVAAQAEYLVNRVVTLFATANLARRTADRPREEFSRGTFELGLRLRY